MATIASTVTLVDRMTSPLTRITGALNSTILALEDMQGSMDKSFDTSKIDDAKKAIVSANASIVNLGNEIDEANNKQKKFNDTINLGTLGVNKLVGAFAGMIGIRKIVDLSDTFTQTRARLDLMNDGLQTTKELEDKIFASAQRSRASYQSTADMVSKLGSQAKGAFKNNDELIMFTEQLNKNFVLAGTSQQGIASAQLQLTQALASGVLRGEELNAVFENATPVIQKIADYLEVDIGQIRKLAGEGKLSAQVVKNALLASAEETNRAFESMPMTWGQVWTNICNRAYRASQPLLNVINLLANNWSILEPTILGTAAAIAIYLLATKGVTLATNAWTVAQTAFNAVMAMNPIIIVVMAIMLLIGLLYAGIAAFNKFSGSSVSATGIICGGINVVIQFFWNLLKEAANACLAIGAAFGTAAYNIYMYFNNEINKIKAVFWGLLETGMEVITELVNKLNKLPFIDINVSGLEKASASFAAKKATALSNIGEYKSITAAVNKASHTFNAFEKGWVSSAYNNGRNYGKNIFNSNNNDNAFGSIQNSLDNISKDTSSISDNMDITSEDLKYLRDLAEQEVVNRFTVAEVKIEMNNNNNINSEMDLDGMVNVLADKVEEAFDNIARGEEKDV